MREQGGAGMDDSSSMLHLERFEREWRSRPPADLDAHLPPRDSPGRREILLDLVHVDLEYRWKAGLGRPVEDYLARYPELSDDPDAVPRLAAWEFELRRRAEPGLEPGEYVRRFPDQAQALAERLAQLSTQCRPRSAGVPAQASQPEVPGYEVLGELGRGGMGVVYKARQVALDRLVALKVIRAELSPHPAARQRFAAEAKAIARLDHPGIVRVYESGLHGGQPYFVLEFVAGGSLAERLRRGPLPPRRAAELVARLADAVQHAHEQGVVHRDLKPANVLLPGPTVREGVERGALPHSRAWDGEPKIADFGLARYLGAGAQTHVGDRLGTPAYMSPEQARGEPEMIGPATDVFGLGAVLYECLTGRPPHLGGVRDDVLRLAQQGEVEPPRRLNPRVPAGLERICLRALSSVPSRRPPSAKALADDLRRYLRLRRALTAVGFVLVLFVGLGLGGWAAALAWPKPPLGAQPVVSIKDVTFLATVNKQADWVNVREAPRQALPVRNGELFHVTVTLDQPGYVYLVYLDGQDGSRLPLYPWNDGAEIKVRDLATPPPRDRPTAKVLSPRHPAGAKMLGWPMEGKSSLDGILILAHGAPIPARLLDRIVKPLKVERPPERDLLVPLVSRPRDAFAHDRRGPSPDLSGTFGVLRGPGPVAQEGKQEWMNYLAPLLDQIDSVAGFLFTHDGD